MISGKSLMLKNLMRMIKIAAYRNAHAGKRQVVRRLGLVNPFYLKKDIDVQGDVGKEREQV
jgi:hypothetical protein